MLGKGKNERSAFFSLIFFLIQLNFWRWQGSHYAVVQRRWETEDWSLLRVGGKKAVEIVVVCPQPPLEIPQVLFQLHALCSDLREGKGGVR
jgi:hypothetical protein